MKHEDGTPCNCRDVVTCPNGHIFVCDLDRIVREGGGFGCPGCGWVLLRGSGERDHAEWPYDAAATAPARSA